jgi:hypothetical protein
LWCWCCCSADHFDPGKSGFAPAIAITAVMDMLLGNNARSARWLTLVHVRVDCECLLLFVAAPLAVERWWQARKEPTLVPMTKPTALNDGARGSGYGNRRDVTMAARCTAPGSRCFFYSTYIAVQRRGAL